MYKTSSDSEVSDQLYNELKPAVEGANYIVKHMHDKNDYNEVRGARETGYVCTYCNVRQIPQLTGQRFRHD